MNDQGKHRNWKCEKGHTYQSPLPVLSVRCGECARKADSVKRAEMKPDLEKPS